MSESKVPVKERVRHELREFVIVSAYLLICFSAIVFYRYSILEEHGLSTWRFGFAIGKALILGKFILIGKAMRVGERRQSSTLLHAIAVKSLLFLLVLVALSVVEEIIASLIHHRPFLEGLAERGTPTQIAASCVLMLLILIPYFAFEVLDDAMGEGKLKRMLLGGRVKA